MKLFSTAADWRDFPKAIRAALPIYLVLFAALLGLAGLQAILGSAYRPAVIIAGIITASVATFWGFLFITIRIIRHAWKD